MSTTAGDVWMNLYSNSMIGILQNPAYQVKNYGDIAAAVQGLARYALADMAPMMTALNGWTLTAEQTAAIYGGVPNPNGTPLSLNLKSKQMYARVGVPKEISAIPPSIPIQQS